MSTTADRFAELRDILEALCEERITAAQTVRLEELTLDDAAARRFYLEYIDLHGNLYWDAAQSRFAGDETPPFPAEMSEPTRIAVPLHTASAGGRNVKRSRWSRVAITRIVAASAAISAAVLLAAWNVWPARPPAEQQQRAATVDRGALAAQASPVQKGPDDHTNDRRQQSAAAPPKVTNPAKPKAVAPAVRHGAASAATTRRPGRFHLAVAKKNGRAAKAATVPLETIRPLKEVAPDDFSADSPAAKTSADDGTLDSGRLVAQIDNHIRSGWTSAGVEPSPMATDAEWVRRIYLDVVGHIPPEETVNAALDGRVNRSELVDRLLKDPGYARNWANVWTNLLVGRQPHTAGVRRDDLEKFLRDSFAADVPWNEIVYELVAAEGAPDHNPAANFLLAHLNQDAVPATALTARLFLGVQVQCTQCHDHPFTKDKQDRFWELNSFFQQTEVVSHVATTEAGSQSVNASMATPAEGQPELVSRNVGGPIYYETLRGEMRAAFPVYAGQRVDPGPTVNRRRELARLIARGNDRQLALAMVNRTWQHFFGNGFTRPVDDMGPHNAPTHPEVLELLAKNFVASGYNLKQLVRWIAATDAYQRASTLPPGNSADDPTTGTPPLFSRVYLKPLTAEQLYDSLLVATRAKSSARTDWNDVGLRRGDWLQQFVFNYATEENDEATMPAGSVSQALMMMNDQIVAGALADEPGTLLYDVVHETNGDAARIRRMCRSALARNPTQAELDAALEHLEVARDTAKSDKARHQAEANMLEDLFWAYLNANEFAFVH